MVNATLTLPAPGSPGSLSGTSSIAVQTDTTAVPFVANVSSPALNRTYGVGAQIPIVVSLGIPVKVSGTTQFQLALCGWPDRARHLRLRHGNQYAGLQLLGRRWTEHGNRVPR